MDTTIKDFLLGEVGFGRSRRVPYLEVLDFSFLFLDGLCGSKILHQLWNLHLSTNDPLLRNILTTAKVGPNDVAGVTLLGH